MDLLIVPVPIFNGDMVVESYCFHYKKGTVDGQGAALSLVDNAAFSPPLETLNLVGIEAFTIDRPIFVPVDGVALLADLDMQCTQPPRKIIFLLDKTVTADERYLDSMRNLREKGFRFGFHQLDITDLQAPLLMLGEYFFMDTAAMGVRKRDAFVQLLSRQFPHLRLVATNIETQEQFKSLKRKNIFHLYEGAFYRLPLNKGQNEVSPLKANMIRLLNIVRDENFGFEVVSTVVQRDTALSISLMRLVNSPFFGLPNKIKTIHHAVTMLGQIEVRKWVSLSVSRFLGADKPNEITKLSLVRAKFAENLAELFGLKRESQSLFLTGLFSVLDVVLETSMEEAFRRVQVSDEIYNALVRGTGPYYPVIRFVEYYETAQWDLVERMLQENGLQVRDVYDCYIDAISWYSELIHDEIRPKRKKETYSYRLIK